MVAIMIMDCNSDPEGCRKTEKDDVHRGLSNIQDFQRFHPEKRTCWQADFFSTLPPPKFLRIAARQQPEILEDPGSDSERSTGDANEMEWSY